MNRAMASWLAAAAAVWLAAAAAAQEWRGPEALEIRVEDAKGRDVQGAEVVLEYATNELGGPAPMLTDARGRLAVGGLLPGRWALEVRKPGFMSFRAEIALAGGEKPEILLASQHNVPGAVSTMRVRLGRAKSAPAAPSRVERVATRPPRPPAPETPIAPATAPSSPAKATPPAPRRSVAPETPQAAPQPPTPPEAESAPAPEAPVAPSPSQAGSSGVERAPAPPEPSRAVAPSEPAKPAALPAPAMVVPSPAPRVDVPSAVPPAATDSAAPIPVGPPPAKVTPATPIARACYECRPGESAWLAEAEIAAGGGPCPGDLAERLASVPLSGLPGLVASLPRGCAVLVVELPDSARFTGFRYEAAGANERSEDCLPGRPCPVGACRFPIEPVIREGDGATTLLAPFESDAGRRGGFTVYWRRTR